MTRQMQLDIEGERGIDSLAWQIPTSQPKMSSQSASSSVLAKPHTVTYTAYAEDGPITTGFESGEAQLGFG